MITHKLKPKPKLLSVIVPAYRQEKMIVKDIKNIESILKQLRYDYEIILVVDGQIDKTYDRAKGLVSKKIRVYGYQKNHGKGYAVRYGMARARGELISFIDSGMDIDPNGLSLLLEQMELQNADVVIGSKRHRDSIVNYPFIRLVYSFIYQIIVKLLFNLNVRDTQTGLKLYRREVLVQVLPRLLVKLFAFDVELLAVAHLLGFTRIYEAPIRLDPENFRFTSGIKLKSAFQVLVDTFAIFYRLRILHYYNDDHRRRWRYDKDLDMKVNTG